MYIFSVINQNKITCTVPRGQLVLQHLYVSRDLRPFVGQANRVSSTCMARVRYRYYRLYVCSHNVSLSNHCVLVQPVAHYKPYHDRGVNYTGRAINSPRPSDSRLSRFNKFDIKANECRTVLEFRG